MNEKTKMLMILQMAEDLNKQLVPAINDIITGASVFDKATGEEVVGDAHANGTAIATLSIGIGKVFICTIAIASCNEGSFIKLGTGTLAAMTDYFWIDASNRGNNGAIAEGNTPLFVVDNSGGATALDLIMFAPQTAFGSANNNSITKYFNGYIGGIEI